ncbi:hypothetical protein M0805_009246 [Coniferiporia weirii]|nr:hypothetical protein M0805_009246 [Coniferiporia weirii]
MFIIVIGTRASGKSAIKDYLLQRKKFKHVRLVEGHSSQSPDNSGGKNSGPDQERVLPEESKKSDYANSLEAKEDEPPGPQVTATHRRGGSSLSTTSNASITLADTGEISGVDGTLGFSEPARLLDHVTRHWREDFVTEDITTREVLEPFLKRPFVLLVSVDAPTLVRFHRHQKYKQSPSKFSFFNNRTLFSSSRHATATLEQFVTDDDRVSFGPDSGQITSAYLFASHHLCHVNVINSFSTVTQLYMHLEALDIMNPDRLRPGWDSYFMKLASLASHRSNCMKRRVGAILVRDHTIIATGYNGTPRGVPNCNEGGCKRCNEGGPSSVGGFEECLCIHAEENALLEAGRERVGKGAVIYCNTCPCLKCTIKIVQNGVTEVVYNLSYKMDASSARVFEMAGVKLRQYSPPG